MQIIAKRSILFIDEKQFQAGSRNPREYLVHASKDIQEIPAWVGEQEAFKTATQDGTVTEVEVKTVVVKKQPPVEMQAPPVDLQKLSKEDLVAHAQEVHGLSLDPRLKKDEMIEAIEEAAGK